MTNTKKYSIEDFFTKTNNEKESKMNLLFDKEDTGEFLMVKGIEAKSIANDRFESQKEFALMTEKALEIKDDIERSRFETAEAEKIKIKLAVKLIGGWSFSEDIKDNVGRVLEENQGLSDSVIAHASTVSNYFAKK